MRSCCAYYIAYNMKDLIKEIRRCREIVTSERSIVLFGFNARAGSLACLFERELAYASKNSIDRLCILRLWQTRFRCFDSRVVSSRLIKENMLERKIYAGASPRSDTRSSTRTPISTLFTRFTYSLYISLVTRSVPL